MYVRERVGDGRECESVRESRGWQRESMGWETESESRGWERERERTRER